MYALVTWWQLAELAEHKPSPPAVSHLVENSAGLLKAYWTYDRASGKSFGFTLLDSAEHALDLRNAIESHMESHRDSTERLELARVQEILSGQSIGHCPH